MYKWIGALLGLTCMLRSEQLPLKLFTTADGFPDNSVERIVRDPRGFLWFCTSEGLSRFDGYGFTTYGKEQGLPDSDVNDLLVTRSGEYWVATGKGVCRFHLSSPGKRFRTYLPGQARGAQYVAALAEDTAGNIWCSTLGGVYRLTRRADGQVEFDELKLDTRLFHVRSAQVLPDCSGSVWIANPSGLFRRRPDGGLDHYTTANGLPINEVNALLEDRKGRFWAGTSRGLCLLADRRSPSAPVVTRVYRHADGLPGELISTLLETAEGRIWAGTATGLAELAEDGAQKRFAAYTVASGLPHSDIGALAEDREGNLWVGTNGGGAAKMARTGFVSFTGADGLRGLHVNALFETKSGELCVIMSPEGTPWIHVFDGRKFRAVNPKYPAGVTYQGWGWNQHVLQDRQGEWWLPSSAGVLRFSRADRVEDLERATPKAAYGMKAGLPGDEPFRVFEDSRGDVWFSMIRPGHDIPVSVWRRATGRIVAIPEAIGTVSAFREDGAGNLWIAFLYGRLARFRDGGIRTFDEFQNLRAGSLSDLYLDPADRLWVGTQRGGLVRVNNPGADHPSFKSITTAQRLASNTIRCITGDKAGRIYAGTPKGVDRYDPETGQVRHYTSADGLAPGETMAAFRDRHDALWFGTVHGLSRLIPVPDRPPAAPPVFVTLVEAAGIALAVSPLGETQFRPAGFRADQNRVHFGFAGLNFAPGENLLYQYMLEGTDRDWSPRTDQRSAHYAGLAAGEYCFRVRAINADGIASAEPAVVEFQIAPVFWRRWWFQAGAALALLSAAYALHRVRVARMVALERVRTRLATDLHDDIGSSLTRIGVLSELAARQLESQREQDARAALARIAVLSRELGKSMSDIVWAVNPAKDRLQDLSQRIRRYAGEALEASGTEFRFTPPTAEMDRTLEPQVRRQVFLILKEAVNNIIRHSGCTATGIEFEVEGHCLLIRVHDNGRGFEVEDAAAGNGLRSMHRRARELGGELKVKSAPGQGARIELRVPIGRQPSIGMRSLLRLTGLKRSVPD